MASDINYASWPRHVARHIDVGDQKQLFLDDGFLVERAEGIRYVMHQPVKHPHNPLLVPDMPWELQVQLYGSVLWDEEDRNLQNVVHKPNLQIRQRQRGTHGLCNL